MNRNRFVSLLITRDVVEITCLGIKGLARNYSIRSGLDLARNIKRYASECAYSWLRCSVRTRGCVVHVQWDVAPPKSRQCWLYVWSVVVSFRGCVDVWQCASTPCPTGSYQYHISSWYHMWRRTPYKIVQPNPFLCDPWIPWWPHHRSYGLTPFGREWRRAPSSRWVERNVNFHHRVSALPWAGQNTMRYCCTPSFTLAGWANAGSTNDL